MADRADHAAESDLIAQHLGENVIAHEGATDATLLASMIDAHRRTILALVEQQRIANLIALATQTVYAEGMDLLRVEAEAALIVWKPHGLDDEHPQVRPDIAAALGIEVRNG